MRTATMSPIDPVNVPSPPPPTVPRFATPAAGESANVKEPRKDPEVTPPPAIEVVQTASRAYATLRDGERELHFEATDTGLRIEVYDGHGRLVRAIPPNAEMAAALAGGEVTEWQA